MYLNIYVVMVIWYERYKGRYLSKEIGRSFEGFDIYYIIFAMGVWIWPWPYKENLTSNIFVWLNYRFDFNFDAWYLISIWMFIRKISLNFMKFFYEKFSNFIIIISMDYIGYFLLPTNLEFMKVRFQVINMINFDKLLILITSLELKWGFLLFQ